MTNLMAIEASTIQNQTGKKCWEKMYGEKIRDTNLRTRIKAWAIWNRVGAKSLTRHGHVTNLAGIKTLVIWPLGWCQIPHTARLGDRFGAERFLFYLLTEGYVL